MAKSVYHSPTVLDNPPVVQPIAVSHPYVTPTPGVSNGATSPAVTHPYVTPRVSTSAPAPVFDSTSAYARPRG